MNKALLLDRDGVVNCDYGYVHRIDDFDFVDGIFKLTELAQQLGYLIFIITNQSGIARGLYTEKQFLKLQKWVSEQFQQRGVRIAKTYYCPHHPTEGSVSYRTICSCRKPKPGMIVRAQQEFDLDLDRSIMIGDKLSDMKAAQQAGVGNRVLLSSNKSLHESSDLYHFEIGELDPAIIEEVSR